MASDAITLLLLGYAGFKRDGKFWTSHQHLSSVLHTDLFPEKHLEEDDKMEFVDWIGINGWRRADWNGRWYDTFNDFAENTEQLYGLFKVYKSNLKK